MIIAREGESVCVALWPDEAGAAGAVDEEEDEDEVGGNEASGCGGVGAGGSAAAGVWRLYDGLPYGDACSEAEAASPSGYLRFRDADGGVKGATVGNRMSSLATGAAAEDETDKRRSEDDDPGVEGVAADMGGGGKDADVGGGTGRVHLISHGGGGGMWVATALT
jgi:hypothetical protein